MAVLAAHELMHSPVASGSSLQKIQIFLPGTQLESGYRIKCETGESVTSKTDHEHAQSSSAGKRKRGGESSHRRQYSAKKSKQNDDVCTHLHPLQDYLHPGLSGMPFFSAMFTLSKRAWVII